MKNIKGAHNMLSASTPEAKKLIKKIKQFNELKEYFASDEAKKILANDLNVSDGEKYKYGYDDENPYEYVAPTRFRIEHDYNNNAVIVSDLALVTTTGKIGKKTFKEIRFNPNITNESYPDVSRLEQIDSKFKPGAKSEWIKSDKALKISDDIRWKGYKVIEDSFKEYGIDAYFTFEHHFLTGSVYPKDFHIKKHSFEKLYLESAEIDVPCMLHENRKEKAHFEKLKSEGYLENMIKAKVTETYNNWCIENDMPFTSMEFSFFGNSLLLFKRAELKIRTKHSKDSSISSGNDYPIKIV